MEAGRYRTVLANEFRPLRHGLFSQLLTKKKSLDLYHKAQDELTQYSYGPCAVEEKENRTFIGFTGFHHFSFDTDFASGIEILWRIRTQEWNKGYATEAATACLLYAKEDLPSLAAWSFTAIPNKASEKVMQKIGMEKIGEFQHPELPNGHPLPEHILYRKELG